MHHATLTAHLDRAIPCLLLLTILTTGTLHAQTTLLVEDFEDAALTYTTEIPEFSDGEADYFLRTDGSDIHASIAYLNASGSSFFAAMDTNGEGAPVPVSLTFPDISIAGFSDLTFSASFAEDTAADEAEDWDAGDYLRVWAAIDGGDEVLVFALENDGSSFNGAPKVDTNLDGIGDGAAITDVFTLHTAAIPGIGTSLTLRMEIHVDATDEDIAFDDVQVIGYGGLPVELTTFRALTRDDQVYLTWQTATETDNAGFEVEQLQDGMFVAVGFVEGAGTTRAGQRYQHRVGALLPGTYSFRLRQIDHDGTFGYSPTVEVTIATTADLALSAAYPNPFNPTTRFHVASAEPQPLRVTVHDLLGRVVQTVFEGMAADEVQTFTFDAHDLPSGIYLIRAQTETSVETRYITLVR